MIEAFSTPANLRSTLVLLGSSAVLTQSAALVGTCDNPPGIALASGAGAALVLAFVHPWRTAEKFVLNLAGTVVAGRADRERSAFSRGQARGRVGVPSCPRAPRSRSGSYTSSGSIPWIPGGHGDLR